MSSSTNYLTAEQSAKFASVSLDTILQYEKFGLLHPVTQDDGRKFSEAELRELFRIETPTPPAPAKETETSLREFATLGQKTTTGGDSSTSLAEDRPATETTTLKQAVEPSPAAVAQSTESPNDPTNIQSEPLSRQIEVSATGTKPETSNSKQTGEQNPDFVTFSNPGRSNSYDLVQLTDSLRSQIEMLKEERDWLRKRVEVLESRSERDQMLIMSESDTVRTLLKAPKRESFWSRALPWFSAPKA